ncbi:MAG TPA: MBL fold metallo-hydrolase [Solirubrobacteraceae bacterium]|nr:MBL fold metallo-hydrolase [Solirubrobacteraceae bacterium]
MRVVGLHSDVLVATSRVWQTTCTIVRSGEECFVVDSPVFPDELEVLPAVLEHAGLGFTGLLATHADWDHLLGRLAFPGASLGVAETTAARLAAEPGAAARQLRAFDDEHYVERPTPLSLGQIQALPVPGHCELGEQELQLHPADGHTADGMAVWIAWARVLVCGDYLSPVEIPMIADGGSRDAYLATLRRLEPLVDEAAHVVPGHGDVLDGVRAAAILREDADYVARLPDADLPLARRSPAQRAIHAANVERVGPSA